MHPCTPSYEENLGQVLRALRGKVLALVAELSPALLSPSLFSLLFCQGPHKPFVPCLYCAQMCRAPSQHLHLSCQARGCRTRSHLNTDVPKTWERSRREGGVGVGAKGRKHHGIFSMLKPVTWSKEPLKEVKVGRIFHVGAGKEGHERGCVLGAVVVVFVLPPRPQRPASPRTNSSPWFSFSNDNAALSKDPTLPKLIFWQFSKCKLLF